MDLAACSKVMVDRTPPEPGTDAANPFFPKQGKRTTVAKMFCDSCAVDSECGDYADKHGLTDGMWGGRLRGRGR